MFRRMRKVQDVLDVTGTPRRRKPEIGDTRWDGQAWRRWDGRRWEPAAYSLQPELLLRSQGYRATPEIELSRRTGALQQVIADQVASYGASVVWSTPTYVVVGRKRRVSHLFHAVATLVTGGLWALVWLAAVLGEREDRVRFEVDRWGNVWAQSVAPRPT
jgi:hypothetical protein